MGKPNPAAEEGESLAVWPGGLPSWNNYGGKSGILSWWILETFSYPQVLLLFPLGRKKRKKWS